MTTPRMFTIHDASLGLVALLLAALSVAGCSGKQDEPASADTAKTLAPSGSEESTPDVTADEPLPPTPPIKKHIILFLAANPSGTERLALDREARSIQVELERSGYRDCFELQTRWAAEPLDLLRELRRLKPTVVHFSGHGRQDVPRAHPPDQEPHRDLADGLHGGELHGVEPRWGLFFQGADGRAQFVSPEAIEQTFGATGASVKVVILNACYTEVR